MRSVTPTVRQLRVIVAVFETGSITRAAAELRVTHSAVSVALRDLESEMDVQLFDRTTRRLTPTRAGEVAAAQARAVLQQADSFATSVRSVRESEAGCITFAATAAIAATLAPRAIANFAARNPNVTIKIVDVGPGQIADRVQSGEASFGFGNPEQDAVTDLSFDPLFDYDISAMTFRGGPLWGRASASWDEVTKFPIITLAKPSPIRQQIDRCLAEHGIIFMPTYEVNLFGTALAMTTRGTGVSILPSFLLSYFDRTDLRTVTLSDPRVRRRMFIVRRIGRILPANALTFIAEARKIIAQTS